MISRLIHWAVASRLVVLLLALALMAFGGYAFVNVNVEAYPDPAPAIIEIIAQFPGASAEDVERQVTIPLEVALAGMPGLDTMRSQSMFQLADVRCQFEYGIENKDARQEVLNRLTQVALPDGVQPVISPESPTGEILRFTLTSPKDANGRDIYTLNDLKSLLDFTLERRFRRVPRIIDMGSYGGTMKRYEIRPDPDRLRRYGISLAQLENAVAAANRNVGGQYITQGQTVQVVRGLGLIGMGLDPMEGALAQTDPVAAAAYLRSEENKRIREIREIVVASVNNVPVRVGDLVEGGPLAANDPLGVDGVVVGFQSRLGRVMFSEPVLDANGAEQLDSAGARVWRDHDDVVQGIVLLRKGEPSLPALADVHDLVDQLNNTPGALLPGVKIEPYYDRTGLINMTTETVRENLFHGMALVGIVLLMFLGNVRTAVIVAINVPLAVLVAFAALYLRDESANLLSIGAVDFGILVDSSVIIVENIYRRLTHGDDSSLTVKERVLHASTEVQRSLMFSTAIMVCAFLPLFTMQGPAGQIFRPMAHTYAFALGGALLLAVTLSPVLCETLLANVKPKPDNVFVRWLSRSYQRQLKLALRYHFVSLGAFVIVVGLTMLLLPFLGREFMPQLEEGNIYVRGTFPLNASLDEASDRTRRAREVFKKYPEVETVVAQVGRPDDGTDPTGFYNVEFYLPMKPHEDWPIPPGMTRARTKEEVVDAMSDELDAAFIGINWNFSQYIRDGVMEAMSGVKGENSLKIIGPDLTQLEAVANDAAAKLAAVPGVIDVGVFRIMGQSNLSFAIDKEKCARWGVAVDDVEDALETAVGGKAFTTLVEGERSFDLVLRWPESFRSTREEILDIPVDVPANVTPPGGEPQVAATESTGPEAGMSVTGAAISLPSPLGSAESGGTNPLNQAPRRRLRDFVTPLDAAGRLDAQGSFVQPGASTIYREEGRRLIAMKFGVRGRDLGGAVAEAQQALAPVIKPPLAAEWSGEFEQMEQAEQRLKLVVPLSLALVIVMLYLAFFSLRDVAIVLANVVTLVCGGILALLVMRTNFSVSAAVGFISIFGVAIMNGLILVSSIHRLRLGGHTLEEAVMEGSVARLRPMLMTILTAILGLLPAAVSTRIGAQSQQPLAIVVIGGMLMSLLLNQHLTPVLYYVFRRKPPSNDAASLAE
ncbi:MAG: efflux RND transporter permease subunit [Planctomycetales bacterium]|nr:efflux RND transporter permease subunit [Planctomycetales bacterium]